MLDRLCGNDTVKQSLSAALRGGRLSHSILLCGEAGTGVHFAARLLAADYLYPSDAEHSAAEAVLRGEGAECLVLRGEGASGDIKIEAVREMRREIFNTSLSAAGRCVLIRGADKLNDSSANALLKVLEEPPNHVLFILTAPSEAAVMATIRSRANAYSLSPVSEALCTEWLHQNMPEAKNAALLSAVFGGRIGSAAKAAATEEGKERLDKAFRLLEACAKHDEYAMAALLSAYEKDKPAALALFAFASAVFSAAMRGALQSDIAPSAAAAALPHFNKASTRLASNVSTKLVLAMLAADLAA